LLGRVARLVAKPLDPLLGIGEVALALVLGGRQGLVERIDPALLRGEVLVPRRGSSPSRRTGS
jgi:hypothetical protein